mmetsp:Transcript_35066/g.99419  ORF Transcript_35066/g.99419 Transcript_35066/m.99419 type:complete len:235 (-) Transcript_35066:61-765(-)
MLPSVALWTRPMQLVTPSSVSSSSARRPSLSTTWRVLAPGMARMRTSTAFKNSTRHRGSFISLGGGRKVALVLQVGRVTVRISSGKLPLSATSTSIASLLLPVAFPALCCRLPCDAARRMLSHTVWVSRSVDRGRSPTTCGAGCLRLLSSASARFLSRADFTLARRSALRVAACAVASRPWRRPSFLDLCLSRAEAPACRPALCFLLRCPCRLGPAMMEQQSRRYRVTGNFDGF